MVTGVGFKPTPTVVTDEAGFSSQPLIFQPFLDSDLKIVDALSQAPLQEVTETDKQLQKDTDAYVTQVIEGMPVTPRRLQEIRQAQE